LPLVHPTHCERCGLSFALVNLNMV
jgi:hypothetical protein